jgi:hypothetical protein
LRVQILSTNAIQTATNWQHRSGDVAELNAPRSDYHHKDVVYPLFLRYIYFLTIAGVDPDEEDFID